MNNKEYLRYVIIGFVILGIIIFDNVGNNSSYSDKGYDGTLLINKVVNDNSIVNDGSGLYYVDNVYYYKGSVINNYIMYGNKYYRVMSLGDNIKIISNDIIYSDIDDNKLLSIEDYNNSLISVDGNNISYLIMDEDYYIDGSSYDEVIDVNYNNYLDSNGNIDYTFISNTIGIRDVIILEKDVLVTGVGTYENPYVIGG